MKVIGYDSTSPDRPLVPSFVIFEGGGWAIESGLPEMPPDVGNYENLKTPLELPDESWFAVLEDGSTEIFLKSQADEWRIKTAYDLVGRALTTHQDPLKAIGYLRAATALIGVSLPDMLASINRVREPDETLESTFRKIRASQPK
jgi:hypothetical protein